MREEGGERREKRIIEYKDERMEQRGERDMRENRGDGKGRTNS